MTGDEMGSLTTTACKASKFYCRCCCCCCYSGDRSDACAKCMSW